MDTARLVVEPRCIGIASGRRCSGFTLIELMITVAIVAILASIALPAYQDSMRKGRRAQGRTALIELMQQQERYFTQRNTYLLGTTVTLAATFKTYSGDSSAAAAYDLSAVACDALPENQCVRLEAQLRRAGSDPDTNVLWLRSTGSKGCNGLKPAVCWP